MRSFAVLPGLAFPGQELPPLPPIPLQLEPSNGIARRSQREPGAWCRENGVEPPPGSFEENMSMAPGAS